MSYDSVTTDIKEDLIMVFMLNESKARKIFEIYENVAAFTLGSSKGFSENGLEISYAKLSFLPDEDVINGIIAGDIKAKKVIKKAVKALYNPMDDDQGICVSMAQMINMIAPEKGSNTNRKGGPNIIVFVTDDEVDAEGRKRVKFLCRYLTALFMQFGIEPVTDGKVVKKLFKAKNTKKKTRKKVVKKVINFIDANKSVRLNKDGYVLKKMLFAFFALELHQSGLGRVDLHDVSRKSQENLVKSLVRVYTNDNLQTVCTLGVKKKTEKKLCKKLRSKNRAAVAAYVDMVEIMKSIDDKIKLPKVKNGYKGKKPKMNVKKFTKFFNKRKNLPILAMIYAHTACVSLGVEIGSGEYGKYMSNVTQYVADGYGKTYSSAAKAWAKAAAPADK